MTALASNAPEASDLPAELRFLEGGGEATRLILARDWTDHPLGAPAAWPDALKVSISLVLNSPESMILSWGCDDLVFFFNETYIPLLGPRVAWAMGAPFTEVWADAWDQAKPIIDSAFAGRPERFTDLPWELATDRGARDTWWSFSYSRVLDTDGEIAGLFIFTNETTPRVLADAAVKESQERLERLATQQQLSLQQMPGFTAVLTGPEHVYEYVNDAYVTISGPRDFTGRSVRDVFPELAGQGFYELLDEVYASGEPFKASAMPISLAGESRPRFIDFLYQPVRAEGGAVTGIFVGGYDITERVRAEQRREILLSLDRRLADIDDTAELSFAASELLGEALGAIRVGYGAVDAQARTILVERTWDASGYASAAGLHDFRNYGGFFDELIAGRDVASNDVQSDPLTAGDAASFEALDIAAHLDVPVIENGHLVAQMFVHSAEPREWTADEFTLVREVAERTRAAIARRGAEEELRGSEARLTNALVSAQLGTFEWDLTTGRVDMDAQARKIFGIAPDAPIHQSDVFGKISREEAAQIEAQALAAASAGDRMAFDYDIDLADGTSRFIRSSCVAIPSPSGSRFVGVFQDATELKAGERALVSMNEILEARISERTAALEAAHEQLRQAQKMEAVGQLTGGLAHDFNNLLTGMMGNLELLQARIAKGRLEDLDRFINAAQGAGRRAASLTQRLLAFSRRQTLDPRPTDVNRLIAGLQELLQRTVGATAEIEIVAAVGLWAADIDAAQLENAILNLCINGRDAMPDGGKLTIETANKWMDDRAARERDLSPGQYISICVTDTGIGMSPATIERAFEPFYTTKPIGQGTGLGLSMIYGFAKQSGGQVRIYSEIGQGTTVCIYLPRHHGEAREQVETDDNMMTSGKAGQTVLVVDDEATIRHLIDEVLDDLGYTVIGAADGAAGIKVLQSGAKIDLLITDVGLPNGMNGRQVADAARGLRPGLQVLFITGFAENAAVGNGHLEPGMELLTKPFTLEALSAKVAEMLKSAAG